MSFAHSSRSRLNRHALERFPGETLFDKLARAVCRAECLPRKELYEAWEVARRARRRFRGGRVVDLAAGHGLLGWAMLLLDDTSPEVVCVDRTRPQSADRLAAELESTWPRLAGRVRYQETPLESMVLSSDDVVVSAHACGALTDRILEKATEARARVAVLPCCQDLEVCDTGGLEGWLDGALAVDVTRALRLERAGYRIRTQLIPTDITPKNRLLMGEPASGAQVSVVPKSLPKP